MTISAGSIVTVTCFLDRKSLRFFFLSLFYSARFEIRFYIKREEYIVSNWLVSIFSSRTNGKSRFLF